MTPTSVGMRCPLCARERTKVRTAQAIRSTATPVVTYPLIAVNVLAFLAQSATGGGGGQLFAKGALFGPPIVNQHEYWRIVTAGFLHANLPHVFINMLSLYFVGSALEPAIGRLNFIAIYMTSLIAGSFGALLLQPNVHTVGASGAIFGVFGALIVLARKRGIPIWQSGLGPVLLINLLFSAFFPGISIGGHLGGLVGGLISGAIVMELGERRRLRAVALAACTVLAVASFAGSIAVAGGHGLAPNGISFRS